MDREAACRAGPRLALGRSPWVSEKKMFGGLTFLTHGRLTVGVYGAGLIARIGAAGMGARAPSLRIFTTIDNATRTGSAFRASAPILPALRTEPAVS